MPAGYALGLSMSLPACDPSGWVRPSDWLPMPEVVPGDEEIVGLYAVNDYGSNWVSVQVSGDYTVDWGDGTQSNHAAGSVASKNLAWSAISPSTLTSDGWRQAMVRITPQAGQQLTSVQLSVPPAAAPTVAATNWLDVAVALPNATLFRVGPPIASPRPMMMERFQWIGPTGALVDVSRMFNQAHSLRSVTLPDTSNVTNMEAMFSACYELAFFPSFVTQSVTNMALMFNSCYQLRSPQFFDTSNVTTMQQMFQSCVNLVSVPLFNTSKVTNMNSFVFGCTSLVSVPLLDTQRVTDFGFMIAQARVLEVAPEFDMRAGTNFGSMTNVCSSLVRFDPIPARSIVIGSTSANFQTNLSSAELDRVYTRLPSLLARTITNAVGNGTTVTYTTSAAHGYRPGMVISMTGITPSAYNLATQTITDTPTPTTFTVANAATGAFVSGGTATPAGATITVTGNWGTVSDTPSIATAKGWTVTG